MVFVKAFRAIRPAENLAADVSALPYDVMNRAEAKIMAEGNDLSILHVTRAEIDVPDSVGDYDDAVYKKAKDNLLSFLEKGVLIKEDAPVYYIYREVMGDTCQTGIVAAVSVDDYEKDRVMKHELTRREKEADRIRHFEECDCQTEPVFLTYRHQNIISDMTAKWIQDHAPLFDFQSDDKVRHILWCIDDPSVIASLDECFGKIDKMYIADGHHRTASAAAVCRHRKKNQGELPADDPAQFLMAVIFPDSDLRIMAYHRVVALPESFNEKDLFDFLKKNFIVERVGKECLPREKHQFTMYLRGTWYLLKASDELYLNEGIASNLDAAILQKNLFEPYFGIEDPRGDHRIDFVGGIRGTGEIMRRCDNENSVGFCLYPVSIADLMNVADDGEIMPPKSTWFEPKLRSGLFLYSLQKD